MQTHFACIDQIDSEESTVFTIVHLYESSVQVS